jgi:DNA-binding HxlR family transcriptional regulator
VEQVDDLEEAAGRPTGDVPDDLRPVRTVFGKWSTEILLVLHAVPSAGFEDLRRGLPGISPRILSSKLKGLEREGLVRREIVDSRPPRVRYELTDRGWTVTWLARPILAYLRAPRGEKPTDSPPEPRPRRTPSTVVSRARSESPPATDGRRPPRRNATGL